MRKAAYAFFFILIIVAIIVLIGGISLPFFETSQQNVPQKIDVGFVVLNQSDGSQGVNFEDFAPDVRYLGINWEDSPSANVSEQIATNTHIQLVRGYNVDLTGNASSWLFVVRQPEQVSLVTYDHYGQKVDVWQGKYPEKEIFIDQIITPRALFNLNGKTIFPTQQSVNNESRELALAEDKYYLTITGQEKTRNLVFDAKTGALISSND